MPPMHRAMIQRRLTDAHDQLVRARGELAVLDEQMVVANEIADDSRLRALVAETPVAAKDHDEARRQAVVMERPGKRSRAHLRARAPTGRVARPPGGRIRLSQPAACCVMMASPAALCRPVRPAVTAAPEPRGPDRT